MVLYTSNAIGSAAQALGYIPLQKALDRMDTVFGHRGVFVDRILDLGAANSLLEFATVFLQKWTLAIDTLVKHHAERPPVYALVVANAQKHLWRHVAVCAALRCKLGAVRLEPSSNVKICQ